MYIGRGGSRAYQTVGLGRESEIAHAVEHIKSARRHTIAYLGRLGILSRHHLVVDMGVQVAVVAQYGARNVGT